MNNIFSLTQAGVYAAAIGALLNIFNVNIATEEVQSLIEAIFTIGGLIIAWYGRYRKGDITVLGLRRPE